jgi:hypothetical protein
VRAVGSNETIDCRYFETEEEAVEVAKVHSEKNKGGTGFLGAYEAKSTPYHVIPGLSIKDLNEKIYLNMYEYSLGLNDGDLTKGLLVEDEDILQKLEVEFAEELKSETVRGVTENAVVVDSASAWSGSTGIAGRSGERRKWNKNNNKDEKYPFNFLKKGQRRW